MLKTNKIDNTSNNFAQILSSLLSDNTTNLSYDDINYILINKEKLTTLDKNYIKYFNEIYIIFNTKNDNLCNEAAYIGNLNLLKAAHNNGFPWDEDTCSAAAMNGNLDCLKYLHENGCPWDEDTCSAAAENGHLDCLMYAYENDCDVDIYIYIDTVKGGYEDCIEYVSNMCQLQFTPHK